MVQPGGGGLYRPSCGGLNAVSRRRRLSGRRRLTPSGGARNPPRHAAAIHRRHCRHRPYHSACGGAGLPARRHRQHPERAGGGGLPASSIVPANWRANSRPTIILTMKLRSTNCACSTRGSCSPTGRSSSAPRARLLICAVVAGLFIADLASLGFARTMAVGFVIAMLLLISGLGLFLIEVPRRAHARSGVREELLEQRTTAEAGAGEAGGRTAAAAGQPSPTARLVPLTIGAASWCWVRRQIARGLVTSPQPR